MTSNETAAAGLPKIVEQLQGYLGSDPNNLALLTDLVDRLLQAGQGAMAKPYASRGMELAPNDPAWQFRMAVAQHYAGELMSAAQRLKALLESGVNDVAIHFELATVLAALGDWQAVHACLEPLQQQALPEALAESVAFLQVRALHWLGQFDHAVELAEQSLKLMPQAVAVRAALGTLYLDSNRAADAASLFDAVRGQADLIPEMECVGGFVALDAAQPQEALLRFERSATQAPGMARAHLGLGLCQALNGQVELATASLSRATQLMPTHLGSWHALAWMQLMNADVAAARSSFEGAMANDRTFGESHGGLAIIAALEGRPEESRAYIRAAQRLDPNSINAGAAKLLLQNGGNLRSPEFLDQGLKMLQQRALDRDPQMQALFRRMSDKSRLGH